MKILLTGSHLGYNLELFVKHGLESLGHNVIFIGYQHKKKMPSWFRMALSRSSTFRKAFAGQAMKYFASNIEKECNEFEPDLLISLKGEMIDGGWLERIAREHSIHTALWFPDDPRFFNSIVKHVAPYYEYVFTKSSLMIDKYREINVDRVYALPFACDPQIHKFKPNTDRSISISFVGSYDKRRGKVISSLGGREMQIYGPYWNFFYRSLANPPIWGEQVTDVYNKSKIVLNIHVESDLPVGPNMRTFEVPGCCTFMLSDNAAGIDNYYTLGKEMICYKDIKELRELVEYYTEMSEERENIARKAYSRTLSEHTYEQRMKHMLSVIK